MLDNLQHQLALLDLAARLDYLSNVNPGAHSRVLRLISRLVETPDMSDSELGEEVSIAMGIPPTCRN